VVVCWLGRGGDEEWADAVEKGVDLEGELIEHRWNAGLGREESGPCLHKEPRGCHKNIHWTKRSDAIFQLAARRVFVSVCHCFPSVIDLDNLVCIVINYIPLSKEQYRLFTDAVGDPIGHPTWFLGSRGDLCCAWTHCILSSNMRGEGIMA